MAGFIGSWFVKELLKGTYDEILGGSAVSGVTVLDAMTYAGNRANLGTALDDPRLTFVEGSINDRALLNDLVPGHDVVVNFAAESHEDRSIDGPDAFVLTNVLGAHTLFDVSLQAKVPRVVHIGTDEVYGSIDEGSWDEQCPLEPNSPYSAAKASAELLARAYFRTYGLNISTTRCSNNYGPFQFPEKVIPLFVTNVVDGLTVPLYGTGANSRDWLFVDDHCRGIALVVAQGQAGESYNIGGGEELSNRELTERILSHLGVGWDRVVNVADRLGHDLRYSVNDNKIRALGYAPTVTFDEGLDRTIEWYRASEQWWRPLVKRG